MTIGLGLKGAILGFKSESVWGTPVTPTSFLELISGKMTKNIQDVLSKAIPKEYNVSGEHALGGIKAEGSFEHEVRYEGSEVLLLHAMGAVSTAEVASFTVSTGVNDKIDFTIGAGALAATVAAGTYKMGTTQATASSLCKAIYDAIVAAEGTGTYTVSFSTTTMKMTITRSAGTFTMAWATGTNTAISIKALIGYTADDTGGLTYTSDSAVVPVYDHTFTLAQDLPTGLTCELDEDISAFTGEGGKIDSMNLGIEFNNYLKCAINAVFEDINYAAATAATLPTAPLATFAQGAVTWGGPAKSIISAKINLNNKLKKDIVVIGTRTILEPTRGGKREVTGSITVYFEATTEYDAFVAATAKAIVLTFTGVTSAIKTGFSYAMTITLPVCKHTGAPRNMGNEGPITLELPFRAEATDSSTKEMTIVVRNRIASVA